MEPLERAALTEAQIASLGARGRRRRFPKGAPLFLEGDASEHVVLLTSGRVKISYLTDDGREIVLAVREAGDLLGELSAIDGEPRSATATALEPVDAVVVTAAEFIAFLRDEPDAALTVLRLLSRRLREDTRRKVEFGASDTLGRVAGRLAELADRFGVPEQGGVRIELPLTQEEIAGWVGASRKAVTNALAELRARGWIRTGRKTIVVSDLPALRARGE